MRTLVTVFLAVAAASPHAHAQDSGGLNAHAFALTAQDGDIRDHYAVHRPGSLQPMGWFVGGVAEYAHRPLVYVSQGEDGDELLPALDNVVALNLTAGVSPIDRLRISASAPIFLTSTSFGESQGVAAGDVRVDAMALLVDPDDSDGIGVAIVPWIDLPTGATGKFLGRRAVAGGGVVAATVEEPSFTLSSNLGLQGEPGLERLQNLSGGLALVAGIGGNYVIDDVSSVGLEARLRADLSRNDRVGTGSPSEAIVSYRRSTPSGAYLTGGLAAPLTAGAGAAVFRVFVGGGFGKIGASIPGDRDSDGIADDLDACPKEPETYNEYVDDDGCPDTLTQLVVNLSWRGKPVEGAELVITGPDGEQRHTVEGSVFRQAVTPDSMWQVVASRAGCLKAEGDKLVRQDDGELALELERMATATMYLTITDADGKPVPSVNVMFDTETPECVPERMDAATVGQTLIDIGPGRHKLLVGAPGYRVVEVPVLASPGDELPVEVALTRTKLNVTGDRIEILEKVNFETGKSAILPDSFDLLNEVAEVVGRIEGRIEVQGHTDDRGAEMDNLELSQSRAEAVRNYLISKGVPRDRLIAVGYGEARPIEDNGTPQGRAENRRVEFVIKE